VNQRWLWQLVDSAFPTGGFAHAGGLEAAIALGAVRRPADVASFAVEAVRNAGSFWLPYLAAAHAAPEELAALDHRLDGYTPSHVANRASRAQGEAFLRAAAAAFGDDVAAVAELAHRARRERLPCHLAPVEGAALSLLGVPLTDARRMFLFAQLRGITSAAVRLGLVGPLEAQALQARTAPEVEAAAEASADVTLADAAQTTPLLDLYQGHQDRLYSRLFRS
jgi:urease accessory protein